MEQPQPLKLSVEDYWAGREILFYGSTLIAETNKIEPFVCNVVMEIPADHLDVQQEVITREGALVKARAMTKELRRIRHEKKMLEQNIRHEKKMLEQKTPKQKEPETPLYPGRVAMHDDGLRKHVSIVVEADENYTKALFFTSDPTWARTARRATKEELELARFFSSKETYLASVVRKTQDFYPMSSHIPCEYVEKYTKQFAFPKVYE